MKIKHGNKVYLQGYDIRFIFQRFEHPPLGLLNEIFQKAPFESIDERVIDAVESHIYDFNYSFKNINNVPWLMKQNWIVDYDVMLKNSAPEEISRILDNLSAEVTEERQALEALSYDIEYHNRDDARPRYEEGRLELAKKVHHYKSVEDFQKYLTGEIEFTFPKKLASYAIRKPSKKRKKRP